MDVAEIRAALLQAVTDIVELYDVTIAAYVGWYHQSMYLGSGSREVANLERILREHLQRQRGEISARVLRAIEVASESARALAGDDFQSKTTQRARRDLEALTADEIERRFVAQLQRDQATLVARRQRERLRQLSEHGVDTGLPIDPDVRTLLFRPDALGRRRKSLEYVQVEALSGLFNLTNTLAYSLMLARGDTVCALAHALDGTEVIRLDDFLTVQASRMHPRSTLLVHNILDS